MSEAIQKTIYGETAVTKPKKVECHVYFDPRTAEITFRAKVFKGVSMSAYAELGTEILHALEGAIPLPDLLALKGLPDNEKIQTLFQLFQVHI